ncbi:MAG TPA: GNAT family N-acetyltransferase [Kineosporiaceae bacterium]
MNQSHLFPGAGPIRLEGAGLLLREWRPEDVPCMVELFDDPMVKRWTPLASPFDEAAAQAYLDQARARRAAGVALQLAITEGDESIPLGEVLLFVRDDLAEVGWALGAAHRGRRVASRAVRVLLAWAASTWRISTFRALIEPGNSASERVATACGFVAVRGTPVLAESRGRAVGLTAWHHPGVVPPSDPARTGDTAAGDRSDRVAGTTSGPG